MAAPLTDQAIAKIKALIVSGEFTAGAKLPKEQELAARLGLSRNSLREAVRALTMIGVLEPRVGDGTYVTSLEPELLLTGMGFVSDLLAGSTLLEVHQVRRIMEPVATGLAATRLTDEDFEALEACLEQMETAETMQAFIDSDTEFHRIIVMAAGNATLASLIQGLSGGMLRARLWRTIAEEGAIEITKSGTSTSTRRCGHATRARERCRPDPPVRRRALAASRHRERRGARDGRAGAARRALPTGARRDGGPSSASRPRGATAWSRTCRRGIGLPSRRRSRRRAPVCSARRSRTTEETSAAMSAPAGASSAGYRCDLGDRGALRASRTAAARRAADRRAREQRRRDLRAARRRRTPDELWITRLRGYAVRARRARRADARAETGARSSSSRRCWRSRAVSTFPATPRARAPSCS